MEGKEGWKGGMQELMAWGFVVSYFYFILFFDLHRCRWLDEEEMGPTG
jgi:hypothetical protein